MQGLVLINKPKGITSFSAVARIKRLAGEKRVGHTGTLDPMATGVLPIAIGNATKMIPYIEEENENRKEYLFGLRFGIETDSLDITGKTLNTNDIIPNDKDIIAACEKIRKNTTQIPPTFSAVHIDGKRAYELARIGKSVELNRAP